MPQGCGVPRGALQIPGRQLGGGEGPGLCCLPFPSRWICAEESGGTGHPLHHREPQSPPAQGKEEDQAWERASSSISTPACRLGSPCTPSPHRKQAWPRNKACGRSNPQEGMVSRHRVKSTAGETSHLPLSPTVRLPCMFLWKCRCTFAHKRTLDVYQGEDACMLGRGSPGDRDGGSCWGCPIPASFPTVSSSSSSHFAKNPHSSGCCLPACTLIARRLGRGRFMPFPVSERLLPMSRSQCLQPSTAISLPNETFIYITSGMFGLRQSN